MLDDGPNGWPSRCFQTSNSDESRHSLTKSILFDVLTTAVVEGLTAQDEEQQSGKGKESSENAHGLTPVQLLDDQARYERTCIRAEEEAKGPDVDLPGPLMEVEHVVDDGESNDLWRSAEEAL